jgi:hypothetical protein
LAVNVHVPGVAQLIVLVIVRPCPVKVTFSQPLNTTVNGAVPLEILIVKVCDWPMHCVAVGGVMVQLGLGLTTSVAVQVLTHPNASVTVAV